MNRQYYLDLAERNWCSKCERKLYKFKDKPIHQQLGLRGIIAIFGALTVIVGSLSFLPTVYALIPITCTILAIAGWRLKNANR